MFNDRYGLTQAVLEGKKTMTRRMIGDVGSVESYFDKEGYLRCNMFDGGVFVGAMKSAYYSGEVVAVAQRYSELAKIDDYYNCEQAKRQAGWHNKMFVKAQLMFYRIRIAGIKAERLQDISDEDCRREGIIRQSVIEYGDKKIVQWTYFREKITKWYDSPREAFAALIDRITGKGTWERNPWVFAYEFELIKY